MPLRSAADPANPFSAILQQHFLPDAVVATKARYHHDAWSVGDDRSLFHDCWQLRSDDPTLRKDCTFTVRFDSVVDYDGVSLLAPSLSADKLTKKLLCVVALTSGIRRRRVSAHAALQLCRHYDWYVRWKLSRGLTSNRGVDMLAFEEFCDCLKGGGALDLLPILDRLDRMTREVQTGDYEFPTTVFKGRTLVNWPSLADKLGVTVNVLSHSREFRSELLDRLGVLSPSTAEELAISLRQASGLRKDGPTERAAEGLLDPWACMSLLSKSGTLRHDPLTFDPFLVRTPTAIAAEIGRARERTRTLLPEDLFRLIEAAARWVLVFGEHVLKAVDALRAHQELENVHPRTAGSLRLAAAEALAARAPDGMPYIVLNWRNEDGNGGGVGVANRLSVAEAVKHLMTACAILVAAFGFRRLGEVTSLRAGCVREIQPGIHGLTVYIEKTLQDLDCVPVPALVAKAVSLLEELTAETRASTGREWLFEFARSRKGDALQFVNFKINEQLDTFAKTCGLAPPEGASNWNLASHQLRRGAAIMYYYGFRFSSLRALSRQLRHFDLGTTWLYITELLPGALARVSELVESRTQLLLDRETADERAELRQLTRLLAELAQRGEILGEVRCEAVAHRMLQMRAGDEKPIGAGAARLTDALEGMVSLASADVRISSRLNDPDAMAEPLRRSVRRWARDNCINPVPSVAAHCTCRRGNEEDRARAACLQAKASERPPWDDGGPEGAAADRHVDVAFASDLVCLGCAHCVGFSADQRELADKEERLAEASRLGASAATRDWARDAHARLKEATLQATRAARESRR